MKVKVCDCVPGAGKTEAAIAMMKANPNKRYLFVTPYLEEVQRIKSSCPELYFEEPLDYGPGTKNSKTVSLMHLLEGKGNIVHSHALFAYYDKVICDLIKAGGYTLVLDEVMNVINKEHITQSDVRFLFDSKLVELDDDGLHINWLDDEYKGAFLDFKRKAQLHNLIMSENELLFWTIPLRSFDCFDDVYVLTYLFRAQVQRYYYENNGIEFEYYGVRKTDAGYQMVSEAVVPAFAKELINKVHILQDEKANRFGTEPEALSESWYRRCRRTGDPKGIEVIQLGNMVENVLRYRFGATSSKDVIWTTFKEQRNFMERPRYKNRFLNQSARATNVYRNCHHLAYCVNVFFHPTIKGFLQVGGAEVDQDLYALSEMIQWIWRSAIRCGEDIWVYIPSARMRNLLQDWLEALAYDEDVSQYHARRQKERGLTAIPKPRRRVRADIKKDGDVT